MRLRLTNEQRAARKTARSAYHKAWREANAEYLRAYNREYRLKNAEQLRAYDANRKRDPERDKERNAIYRAKYRAEIRARNNAWEKANRPAVTARKKKRRQEDLERCQTRDAAYRKREAARYLVHSSAWQAARRSAPVEGLVKGWDRPIYAEAKRLGLEIDHIIPLRPCRGCGRQGKHEPTNLQFLSRSENAAKNQRCQECWTAFAAEMLKLREG